MTDYNVLQQIFLVCQINLVETKTRQGRTENKVVNKPRNSTTATPLTATTTTTTTKREEAVRQRKRKLQPSKPHQVSSSTTTPTYNTTAEEVHQNYYDASYNRKLNQIQINHEFDILQDDCEPSWLCEVPERSDDGMEVELKTEFSKEDTEDYYASFERLYET